MKVLGSAAKTAYYLKKIQGFHPYWKLQYKLKCKSTEYELSSWLQCSQIKQNKPIAIIAKEQFAGFGQKSRPWCSPRGGIWLSAAYPIFSKQFSSQIFDLSFAFKLCEMFSMENIKVDLKWPNDILFGSKKLIGFLPRVVSRGQEIIYVRIGLGMNFLNKTPPEGISLSKVLKTKKISEYYWTAKILKSLYESIYCSNRKEYVIEKANIYLSKKYLPKGYNATDWTIKNIDFNGNLIIYNESTQKILSRF